MSGTSLRAIANEKGTVTAMMLTAGAPVPARRSQTPRLTTSERTEGDSTGGCAPELFEPQRRYEEPSRWRARPPPRPSSATPWVAAISIGSTAATATIRRAASSERSPAAIGSHGLLRRSISTSSIWLIPATNTFTHRPARRVHAVRRRSTAVQRRGDDVEPDATATCRSACAGARSADTRAPTPPLAGTPSHRAVGDSSQRKLPALWHMPPMLAAYRATGADLPFGDPRGYHGVGKEGHFSRFTQPRNGAAGGCSSWPSAGDALGRPRRWPRSRPTRSAVRSATLPEAWAAPRRLELRAGDAVAADEISLRVDLCEGTGRLSVALSDPLPWPRRAFARWGRPTSFRVQPVPQPVAAARPAERQRPHR